MRRARRGLAVAIVLLALGGCGLFGDDDSEASAPTTTTEAAPAVVRIALGDQWVDIDPESVSFVDAPTESTFETLDGFVRSVGGETTEPIAGSVVYENGTGFVVRTGTDGETPDLESLAYAIRDSGVNLIELPYRQLGPQPSNEELQLIATELNASTQDGLEVAVAGQRRTLAADALGPAIRIAPADDGTWSLDLEWSDLADSLRDLFDDIETVAEPATFVVEPSEDDDAEPAIIIESGGAATFCCDAASKRRILRAIEDEIEVATLLIASDGGETSIAAAEELGINELVGSFTTRYTPGQNRVINIRRIAELTQGVVIPPGETFSLNDFVGRRTRENGFVAAGTIVNGHLVDSVGGGISQYATTIFNAAFFAGLEFEEYQAHSIYFSRYPYGREATISWPRPHLKIHNPTPYGILIWPTSTANSVTVDIYSTKWVEAEQTGQWETAVQAACTRVTTERTRTWVDEDRVEVDTVFATYRPEGIACDGTETQNPDEEQVEALENGEDPNFENGGDADPNPDDPTTGDGTDPDAGDNTDSDPGDAGEGDGAGGDGAGGDGTDPDADPDAGTDTGTDDGDGTDTGAGNDPVDGDPDGGAEGDGADGANDPDPANPDDPVEDD